MLAKAATELTTSGLRVSSVIDDTNPKQLLVTEASSWGADCIFVGAKGHPFLDRILLGSVSAAVSARADCSVEVVRPSYP
jgi:nucleotide-binding universal stress UspA family protein